MDKGTPADIEKPEWLLQMESILETLNEGVMVANDCQKILFINSHFEEMTGFHSAEVVGRTGAKFYTPEEFAFIEAQTVEGNRTGQNRYEFVVPKKDGSRLPVIIG